MRVQRRVPGEDGHLGDDLVTARSGREPTQELIALARGIASELDERVALAGRHLRGVREHAAVGVIGDDPVSGSLELLPAGVEAGGLVEGRRAEILLVDLVALATGSGAPPARKLVAGSRGIGRKLRQITLRRGLDDLHLAAVDHGTLTVGIEGDLVLVFADVPLGVHVRVRLERIGRGNPDTARRLREPSPEGVVRPEGIALRKRGEPAVRTRRQGREGRGVIGAVIVVEGDGEDVLGLQALIEDVVAASHLDGVPLGRGARVVDATRLAQGRAIGKGITADGREAGRQADGGKPRAALEGVGTDGLELSRKGDVDEAGAACKRAVADAGQSGARGRRTKDDGPQVDEALKRVCPDAGDKLANGDARDGGRADTLVSQNVRVSRAVVIMGIVPHGLGAGETCANDELARVLQLPGALVARAPETRGRLGRDVLGRRDRGGIVCRLHRVRRRLGRELVARLHVIKSEDDGGLQFYKSAL